MMIKRILIPCFFLYASVAGAWVSKLNFLEIATNVNQTCGGLENVSDYACESREYKRLIDAADSNVLERGEAGNYAIRMQEIEADLQNNRLSEREAFYFSDIYHDEFISQVQPN